ncbi:N-formylglutamate deformylase [Advenella sp. S44]|uniref:N-formylglutamate deformylase n=1 Tax=Advenella sp. S44 TaxID=1982755 RepID=UPI000C2978F3|nr:N-formylglutamate deformylase [Advenella sp. S44]PJX27743.1 N-formylglutamate deformylase [Advenella sp. S44]
MPNPIFSLQQGSTPLLISIPHMGTRLDPQIAANFTQVAGFVDDTDWHLDRLYAFARDAGASFLTPVYSRYVIDLNRPPDDENLYPGQDTTGLCPVDTFNKEPLYLAGREPSAQEKARRRKIFWEPYHSALEAELQRIKDKHGYAVLWEAHSIRSQISRFFPGRLTDFNFGTANDTSAHPQLCTALASQIEQDGQFTAAANGRFKGGYITRQYGKPAEHIHAVQLELTQIAYMQETRPFAYDPDKADKVTPLLEQALETALQYARR